MQAPPVWTEDGHASRRREDRLEVSGKDDIQRANERGLKNGHEARVRRGIFLSASGNDQR